MKVYQAINKVQAALAVEGISKGRSNQQQGYKFRGIDDVYNALAPQLAKHGLCILPRCTERTVSERVSVKEYQGSKKESVLFYVCVRAEFDFVCAEDGSKHTVTTYGEAMDSGDKATNKAMSAAYKYACMQAFSIPTEGDNDADAHTHEVQAMPDRTLVMKVQQAIADAVAQDKEMSALEEWQGAVEQGEDFGKAVWAGLTTPQRNYIRALNQAKAKA